MSWLSKAIKKGKRLKVSDIGKAITKVVPPKAIKTLSSAGLGKVISTATNFLPPPLNVGADLVEDAILNKKAKKRRPKKADRSTKMTTGQKMPINFDLMKRHPEGKQHLRSVAGAVRRLKELSSGGGR